MRGGTTTGAGFREAAQHEHELNERQREILRLIEKGYTNREIAEMLGISLDGAKWNVSEILGKLGLASREEAAEYWRWRHQGSRSRVRALLGAPLARVAVGVGLTVVATGTMIAIAAAFGGDSHEQSQPLVAQWVLEGGFYQRREVANWMLEPPENADRGTVRWVYVDETHWRIGRRYRTERDGASSGLVVADGQFVHILRGRAELALQGPYQVAARRIPQGFRVGWPGV